MSNLGPTYSTRPVLRVNLKTLKQNYMSLQKLVGKKTKVAASVKADAYGLGAHRVGRTLYGAGCRTFFVATAGEGKIVREAVGDNASIYVLNGPAPRDLTLFFGSQLKPVISSMIQAYAWADATKEVKRPPYSAVHIDTGLNRLGFPDDEFEKLVTNKKLFDRLKVDHVMSHLACAPDKTSPFNREQLQKFRKQSSRLPVLPLSFSNSAGIYLGDAYHFQLVRPGISLYGGIATDDPSQEVSQPVVSLMAPVLQLRYLQTGDKLGYNSTFVAKTEMLIAIVGAGYADGIPVIWSSSDEGAVGHATLQKRRVPILGRVSMDLTALDVTGLKKKPRIGDWAEFLGDNLESDAHAAKTINYELLTNIGSRVRREYV